MLQAYCWRESPPASLPKDDTKLADIVGMTVEAWNEIKSQALAGFAPCTGRHGDNRLYHCALVERARGPLLAKRARRRHAEITKAAEPKLVHEPRPGDADFSWDAVMVKFGWTGQWLCLLGPLCSPV
jgi:hypothetical protein